MKVCENCGSSIIDDWWENGVHYFRCELCGSEWDYYFKYRVMEGCVDIILETDDLNEALTLLNNLHSTRSREYHEIYKYDSQLGFYTGAYQYKPGDRCYLKQLVVA